MSERHATRRTSRGPSRPTGTDAASDAAEGHREAVHFRPSADAGALAPPDALRRSASAPRIASLRSLQRSHGNAAVQVLLRDGGRVSDPIVARAPAAPAGEAARPLTQRDRFLADNAKRLVTKAIANKAAAQTALGAYAAGAPKALTALQTTFDGSVKLYDEAHRTVNRVIETAKEIAAVQDAVLTTVINAALGGLGTAAKTIGGATQDAYEKISEGYGQLMEFYGPLFDPKAAALGAAGIGTGSVAAPEATAPWAQELAFTKSLSELQAKGNRLLPLALGVGAVGEKAARVDEALRGIADSGRTRSDLPLAQLDREAAALESATRTMAASAGPVSALLTQLTALVAQSAATAPKDVKEVEAELWVRWAASLSVAQRDLMDLNVIEDHLRKIGIWDRLGLDIGQWFSNADEELAAVSAKAQAKILAHKGEVVDLRLRNGNRCDHTVRLGELDPVGVRMDPSGTAWAAQVRAVVVGATATQKLDPSVLDQGANVSQVSAYLYREQLVKAVLRSYEIVSLDGSGPGAP